MSGLGSRRLRVAVVLGSAMLLGLVTYLARPEPVHREPVPPPRPAFMYMVDANGQFERCPDGSRVVVPRDVPAVVPWVAVDGTGRRFANLEEVAQASGETSIPARPDPEILCELYDEEVMSQPSTTGVAGAVRDELAPANPPMV